LYKHFTSKEELACAAMVTAKSQTCSNWGGGMVVRDEVGIIELSDA
jgi:hypothetical protein